MTSQTAIRAAERLPQPELTREITPQGGDYEAVRAVIEKSSVDYRDQPSLEELADEVGETPNTLQKLFSRWAGLTPKGFLQAVTLDHARRLLAEGAPLLDTAYEVGMSGPGRLHDLFVTHEAMTPGHFKNRGAALTIRQRPSTRTPERTMPVGFQGKAGADRSSWPAENSSMSLSV